MSEPVDITWHAASVRREERERLNGQQGTVVWLTGLSGSGKSTIANAAARQLHDAGQRVFVLDGDNVRHGLCAAPGTLAPEHGLEFAERFGLGFGPQDREENIRRVGSVCQLLAEAGLIVLAAFVSPYRRDRDRVRQTVETAGAAGDFLEVFVDTPLEECERRDPKGLYRKARAGEIENLTGLDAPYEPPEKPALKLTWDGTDVAQQAAQVVGLLAERGRVPRRG